MFENYLKALTTQVHNIDLENLSLAVNVLQKTYESGHTIFVMGNGGSAATANHFAADFEKNAVGEDRHPPKIVSLASAVEKILAYGNDYAFDTVFARQLDCLATVGDTAVFISASGNSPNIIEAVKTAKKMGVHSIGLTGFSGGLLKETADICLHVPFDSYEITEDLHSIYLHMIVCTFKKIYRGLI